ncbi:MAG: tRNA pseudouridine(38-40) synthase TruA [Myxococcales bacterium]
MGHYRLVLEYDGAAFEGWQIQAGASRTVQGCLVEAAQKISQGEVKVRGSGRTDSGVHAEGQVVALEIDWSEEPLALLRALNGNLPRDVAVRSASATSPDFDPRRHAEGKQYRYAIWNGPARAPLRENRWTHIAQPLDLDAMGEAARGLLGIHDFACFQASGSDVLQTVREIFSLEITGESGAEIVVEVEGSGFLRHMVRNIAGTLIEVGRGKREPASMADLIASLDRGQAGPTAPAKGLTLVRVDYPATSPQRSESGGCETPSG